MYLLLIATPDISVGIAVWLRNKQVSDHESVPGGGWARNCKKLRGIQYFGAVRQNYGNNLREVFENLQWNSRHLDRGYNDPKLSK
jgi:hypothetical protein